MHLSRSGNSCVVVDLPFMKPYCFDDKMFSALMWVIIESLTKDSINLHTIDVKLMGLQFSALFQASFLNIGKYWYAIFSPAIYILYPWFCLEEELKVYIQHLLILLKFGDAFHQVRMIYSHLISMFRFPDHFFSNIYIREIYFSLFIENGDFSIRLFCKNT